MIVRPSFASKQGDWLSLYVVWDWSEEKRKAFFSELNHLLRGDWKIHSKTPVIYDYAGCIYLLAQTKEWEWS